jgi:hypothetical protein
VTHVMHEFITADSFTLASSPFACDTITPLLNSVKWRRFIYAKDLVCLNYICPPWESVRSAVARDRVAKFVKRELRDVVMAGGSFEDWICEWVVGVFRDGVGRDAVEVEIEKVVGRETKGFVERVLVFVGSGLSVEAFDQDARWGERSE